MLSEIKITDIKVGQRHRRDMGDLTTLAESIRQEGLLQPIGVTDRLELVFGERRLLAYRDILKRKTILARIVSVSSILAGEYHENEVRKDFTPSERVAIAKAIEQQIGNRRGQRVQKSAQVEPGRKTRDAAAERAGFGNHETYRQAAKVVENGTPRLIQAMDGGRVSISAAALLADADPDEQDRILDLDEKAILQAAKEIRFRKGLDNIIGRGETNEWLTPPFILKALGKFDLDPCASLQQPSKTATRQFTILDDGLNKVWSGRVWLNPP
jgi:ParB family chromosome partitioning protein